MVDPHYAARARKAMKRHSQQMPEVHLPPGYEPPSAAVGPQPKSITAHLLSRSASYWRDAVAFREMGDVPMAVAYETISRELHAAAQIDGDADG